MTICHLLFLLVASSPFALALYTMLEGLVSVHDQAPHALIQDDNIEAVIRRFYKGPILC